MLPANAFLATMTREASESLVTAFQAIPADHADWAPEGCRSALDMLAECAVLNGKSADVIAAGEWVPVEYTAFLREKKHVVSLGSNAAIQLLRENTDKAVVGLQHADSDRFTDVIETQFGPMPFGKVCRMPFWNMSYHEGQINMLGMLIANL